MKIAAFDLETIPSQSLPDGCKPMFDLNDVKLGNLKDSAKISAKLQEAQEKFQDNLDKKMATSPTLCQVCLFAACVYDTELSKITWTISQWDDHEDGDYSVVFDAWQFITKAFNEKIPLVTFNGIDFDLPVLFHRAMLLDVPLSQTMYAALTPKWTCDKSHYDLMKMLVGPYPERGRSLDFFLKLFQLGQKTIGIDGSQVYGLWQAGEYDKILEYGKDDVAMTCKLFARVSPWLAYQ